VSLVEADLTGADCTEVNASHSDLRRARLGWATLVSALFNGTDLRGADLRGAELAYAVLNGVRLEGADLTGAQLSRTVIARCEDLHLAIGLESVVHPGSSALDVETLRHAAGRLPERFLAGIGVGPFVSISEAKGA
jgi:uncharacterized protein YjbI with pentapeptide repeats